MTPKFKNFDDEEKEEFARCGRLYHDITPTVNLCQKEYINDDPEMDDQILVMATPKHRLHPTKNCSFFVTNYSTDRKPFNEVGRIRGEKSLKTERKILWALDKRSQMR